MANIQLRINGRGLLLLWLCVALLVGIASASGFFGVALRNTRKPTFLLTRGGFDGRQQQPSQQEAIEESDTSLNTTAVESDSKEVLREEWREKLPERLARKSRKTLQKLRLGNTDVYLLGTAHVSNESAADAEALLECIKPECVFVELCDARIPLLEGDDEEPSMQNLNITNSTTRLSFFEKIKATQQSQGGSRLQAASTVLLTDLQEDYASELGVELGGEFRKAHQYWQKQQGSHLILGDRPLQLTLYRAWESLSWWPKIKVMVGLLVSSFSKPDKEEIRKWIESIMLEESDVLTESFNKLRKAFPSLYRVIVEERDCWLAAKLFQTCRFIQGRRLTIVAIVGAGHVPGICQWLTHPKEQTTPEQILFNLTTTRRWANDDVVQKELLPSWIHEVSELQRIPQVDE